MAITDDDDDEIQQALPDATRTPSGLVLTELIPDRAGRRTKTHTVITRLPCLHEGGFTVSGEANNTLTFFRPDGMVVG